jgi:hypothetical protein
MHEAGPSSRSRGVTQVMLQKTEYTAKAVTLQSLAIERKGARTRARLAAKWLVGRIEVKRTVALAAVIFDVSQPYINEALGGRLKDVQLARLKNGHNGNGNGAVVHDTKLLPFVPNIADVWSHLTDEERDEFVLAHLDSVWAALERVTA